MPNCYKVYDINPFVEKFMGKKKLQHWLHLGTASSREI